MENCRITVVIPMYNVERFLEKCVESVSKQAIDFSYEIIMVDDGSPDGSLQTAQKLAEKNRSIRVISQENKGLGGARNTGIRNAAGKYILFLDADDELAENALPLLLEKAEKEQVDILEFAAEGRNENGGTVYKISNSTQTPLSGKAYYNRVRYMHSACNKIYSAAFLKQHCLWFTEKIFIEDFEFNTRAFARAEKVMATDVLGAYFLQTSDSITRTASPEKIKKMQTDFIKIIGITADLFGRDKKDAETVKFYQERLGFLTVTLFYQLFKRSAGYNEVKSLKKELIQKGIFYPDFKTYDLKKEIFRRLLVKNIAVYPFLLRLKKLPL